jgi:hypothetical protein
LICHSRFHTKFLLTATCILLLGAIASASSEKVLHIFDNSDGSGPYYGVVFDATGNPTAQQLPAEAQDVMASVAVWSSN